MKNKGRKKLVNTEEECQIGNRCCQLIGEESGISKASQQQLQVAPARGRNREDEGLGKPTGI